MTEATVYRFDVPAANAHFRSIHSWYEVDEYERRVITGEAHDDYVDTEAINELVDGSVPRRLLIATDENAEAIRAAFKTELEALGKQAREREEARMEAFGRLTLEAERRGMSLHDLVDQLLGALHKNDGEIPF